MKRRDITVIVTLAILILILFIPKFASSGKLGHFVVISENGKTIGTYPIGTDQSISLSKNIIQIKDSKVYMLEADCPDGLCIEQGKISSVGSTIVCLPNRVSVQIIDKLEPQKRDGFYFNTYVSITLNDSSDETILDEVFKICDKYENICSRTQSNSELYKLNHRLLPEVDIREGRKCYQISDELYNMIKVGKEFSNLTNDKFCIAIAPVTSLWDFTSGEAKIPSDIDIRDAIKYTSSDDITLYPNNTISFKYDENMIDLGGMAKGYIADRIKEYLISRGVHSGIIALGGNILCLGDKNGEPFNIGIKEPFKENNVITTVNVRDKSVVTSGIYERYFKYEDKIYHHILNPQTGYPVENDLYSVTVISDSSALGDCLSTYLYSLGLTDALEYVDSRDDISAIFINADSEIIKSNFNF